MANSPPTAIANLLGRTDSTGALLVTGAGGASGPVTIADGADVAQGTTTDAAITTNASGTVIGFLRGLVTRLLAQTLDYDTGAGTATQVIFGIALPASGGPVAGGTTTNPLVVVGAAPTSGGWTPKSYITSGAANQDSTVVKGSAGQVGFLAPFSTVATARFVKVYDKSTAPTSADTPVHRIAIPANTTGAGSNLGISLGAAFANGISFRVTTGAADSDTGACSTNDVLVNIGYL